MKLVFVVVPGLMLGLALAGCTQVAAIAPVGGAHVSEVRYAALDILVEQGVDVGTVPVCTEGDDQVVTCAGTTDGGAAIDVTSTADTFTLTVGGSELYSGNIQDVLQGALEPAS